MSEGDSRVGRILIVEDDETFGGLLERYLGARGHAIHRCRTTEEAIEALVEGPSPSLILLDINLPGDTGWGLLRHDAYRVSGRPPVVILSATAVSAGRLGEFGVAGYLPKPFPLETLVATVDRLTHASEAGARP